MDRLAEMSEQRRLIEEKKQEILRKISEKRKKKEVERPSTTTNIVTSSNKSFPVKIPRLSSTNVFKNDGSFLEQFKKMQESCGNTTENSNAESSNFEEKTSGNISMKIVPSQTKTLQPTPAQAKLSSEDDEKINVSSPEDRAVKIAVEKVAISVAVNGELAEEVARTSNASDPAYNFLNQTDGETYKLYQKRVSDLVEAKKRAEADGHLMTFGKDNKSESASKKRKKSRWAPQDSENDINTMPRYVQQDPGLVSYAVQVFGSTDLTADQWKQLEDQRKMRLLFEMMQAKQREAELRKLTGKYKYEYDSDEETEGGTWEHKKRAMEMQKTKTWADELTDKAKGKHHIGDFLPPDELENFLEKWDAVKQGRPPDLSDYKEYKLTSENKGYQMLQKLGWSEGQGLGATGGGIVEPVNKHAAPMENAGLGQCRPDDIKAEDDEYEAYRKRMMLAYRFRPNPLNNPRRPYY